MVQDRKTRDKHTHSWSPVAQTVERLPAMWETRVQLLGQEDPLEKEMATTPVLLPGKSHGQRSMVGCYSPWGRKESDTTERLHSLSGSVVKNLPAEQELQKTQVQSLGQEDPLEKGMTTHSSILA